MITLKTFDKKIDAAVEIIKNNQLHYKSGSGLLKSVNNGYKIHKICIAYFNKNPVGCGLIIEDECNIQIFVKKEYRRLGIGTKIIKALNPKEILDDIHVDDFGYKGKFWNSALENNKNKN